MNQNSKNLIRRYLVWCFKTTKEDSDMIDRYFTQNIIDEYLAEHLLNLPDYKARNADKEYKKLVDDFINYKNSKMQRAKNEKFAKQKKKGLMPRYKYLKNRLFLIEKAICHFLGKKDMRYIRKLYEEEMIRRILAAVEHH